MTAPGWWPDWTDEDAAIIASGPSVRKEDVALLRGRCRVIAIKENIELAPWADALYGCDAAWWRNNAGRPKHRGLKICATPRGIAGTYPDIEFVTVEPSTDRLLFDKPALIGSGGNSGFQALNIAVQWGIRRILLLGFDCSDRSGTHWYGRNRGPGQSNPDETNFRRWRAAFATAAEQLAVRGVEVINASLISTIPRFPRATVQQALDAWATAR